MVKKPETLKKAAREDAEAAEEAEDADFEKEEDGEEAKKKRKARPAKLRRDNKKKREREVKEEEKKKRDGDDKDDEDFLDRRIFVANLPEKTTCEDLREIFEKFGTVHSARLHVNSKGQFRGVGFVTFESIEELEQALQVNGMEHKKATLKVEKAQPPPKRSVFDVFVGGLPYAAEEKKIRKHFKSCGEIKKVRMIIDWEKKKFNGTAFLRFKTAAGAEGALKLNDSMFAGRTVTVKLALPKKKLKDRKDIDKVEAPKQQSVGGELKKAKKGKESGSEIAEAKGEKRKASEEAAEEPAPKKKKTLKEEKKASEEAAEEPAPKKKKKILKEEKKASEEAVEEPAPEKKKTLKKKKKAQAST